MDLLVSSPSHASLGRHATVNAAALGSPVAPQHTAFFGRMFHPQDHANSEDPMMPRPGAISQIRAQARASLKNPTRPFTPRDGRRPLFHGNDYRPGSRPSSSFSNETFERLELGLEPLPSSTPDQKQPNTRYRRKVHKAKESEPTEDNSSYLDEVAECKSTDKTPSPASKQQQQVSSEEEEEPGTSDVFPYSFLLTRIGDSTAFTDEVKDQCEKLRALVLSAQKQNMDDHLEKELFQFGHDLAHTIESCDNSTTQVALLEIAFRLLGGTQSTNIRLQAGTSSMKFPMDWTATVLVCCRALFRLSKESENDSLFCQANIVESILSLFDSTSLKSASHSPGLRFDYEPLVYAAGALKGVSTSNEALQTLLARHGAIAILKDVLTQEGTTATPEAKSLDSSRQEENGCAQLLVQITAVLRNLALKKAHHKQFYACEVITSLCNILHQYPRHDELMLNVNRILSKLTLHDTARREFSSNANNYVYLLNLIPLACDAHRLENNAMLIRVFFTLGNLTASNSKSRNTIWKSFQALDRCISTLKFYTTTFLAEKDPRETVADVLVKLIRLLANLAINESIALELVQYPEITCLIDILSCPSITKMAALEELMLNCVSCITNLSYFSKSTAPSSNELEKGHSKLVVALTPILLHDNIEAVAEGARAFGNISRFPDGLQAMADSRVLEILTVLLDHRDDSVVYIATGVLMNASLDTSLTNLLVQELQLGPKLVGILRSTGLRDLELSAMTCKGLCNLFLSADKSRSACEVLKEDMTETLAQTLDELVHAVDQDDDEEDAEANAFVQVAQVLENTLRSHTIQCDLEALEDKAC